MVHKETLKLIGAFNSRLCHDLIAPAGAAEIGLSLIEDGITDEETIKLLADSVRRLVAKLNFFRGACGFGKAKDTPSLVEGKQFAQNYLAHEGLNLTWTNALEEQLEREGEYSRLLLCLINILSASLTKKGEVCVHIQKSAEKGIHVKLKLSGPRMVLKERDLQLICDPQSVEFSSEEINPHDILQVLLQPLLTEHMRNPAVIDRRHDGDLEQLFIELTLD